MMLRVDSRTSGEVAKSVDSSTPPVRHKPEQGTSDFPVCWIITDRRT